MMANRLGRLLLLALPGLLVPLTTYVTLDGQIKFSGLVILALFVLLLECVAVLLFRYIRLHQRRRREP
jgi:hypothetical protein